MITIFNRKSVFFGYDKIQHNRVLDILEGNKIKYSVKISDSRMYRASGSSNFGESSKYQATAEIFVHKDNWEKASHLIECN